MQMAVRVRLVVKDDPGVALAGAHLALFDRDEHDPDDYLAAGVTDADGWAQITFNSDDYTDREDHPELGDHWLPDLYVIVYGKDGGEALSTRALTQVDVLPEEIVVGVDRSEAQRHGLV